MFKLTMFVPDMSEIKLKVGDSAPDFSAVNEEGKMISSNDFKGKKWAIFFYPKDLTPTCTNEVCNLRDNFGQLKKSGFELLGVSADSEKKHQKFISKYKLPFSLLADTDKKVINKFGVWGKKKLFGKSYLGIKRMTFVMNESGIIIKIIDDVKSQQHADQILDGFEN